MSFDLSLVQAALLISFTVLTLGALFMAGAQRLYLAYLLLFIAFILPEISALEAWHNTTLSLRWIILPGIGAFIFFQVLAYGIPLKTDRFTAYFFLLIMAAAMSAFTVSAIPMITIMKTGTLAMLFFTIFIAVRSYLDWNRDAIHTIAVVFGWFAVITVYISFFLFLVDREGSLLSGWLKGPFRNPNFLGAILLSLSPFLFYNYMNPRGKVRLRFFWITYAICAVLLVLTHSRNSMLAFLLIIFTLLLVFNKKYLPVLFFFGAIAFSFLYASNLMNFSLRSQTSLIDEYVYKYNIILIGTQRMSIQEKTLEIIGENPYLGVGFGISEDYEEDQTKLLEKGYLVKREKSNSFLAVQEELGLLGSAIILLLLGSMFYRTIRTIRYSVRTLPENDPDLILMLTYFSSVVGMILTTFFEAYLLAVGNSLCLLFWTNFLVLLIMSDVVWDKLMSYDRQEESAVGSLNLPVPSPLILQDVNEAISKAKPKSPTGRFTY